MKTIHVRNGLVYDADNKTVVNVVVADDIARANGLVYAEHFTKAHDGQTLQLDDSLKVIA